MNIREKRTNIFSSVRNRIKPEGWKKLNMEVIYFVIKRCRKEYHNGLFKIKYGLCNEVIDTTLMNTSKIKRNIITFQTQFYFHITWAHIHNCVSPGPTIAKHKCSSGTKKNREYISMFSTLGQIYKFACCFLYVFISISRGLW